MTDILISLKNFLPALTGTQGSWLVFESDGFTLSGAVIIQEKPLPVIRAKASSRNIDFSAAVTEIVDALKKSVGKIPNRAALIAPGIVSAMLDLPVDPRSPRSDDQMQEMVRWELEPLFAQQNELWRLGAVLMGRGLITAKQRQEILVDLELSTSAGGGRQLRRFGEIAIEKGYVDRAELDQCLLLHETLVMVDDDILCGWQPQVITDVDGTERYVWYACGMGMGQRKKWVKAFERNNIRLIWLYPMVGSCFPALHVGEDSAQERILIAAYQEQIACIRGTSRHVVSMTVESRSGQDITVEDCINICHEHLRPGIENINVYGIDPSVSAELSSRLERKIQTISPESSGLVGVAAHLFAIAPQAHLPRVEAQDPAPPLWKNVEVRRFGALAAVFLLVIIVEISLQIERAGHVERLVMLDQKYSEDMELSRQMQGLNSEANALQKNVSKKQIRLAEISKNLSLAEDVLFYRQRSIPGLLRSISDVIGDEVVIDAITEAKSSEGYFLIEGWSMSDTAAQLFIANLDKKLLRWDLTVSSQNLRRGQGRAGHNGYNFSFRLVPRVPMELSLDFDGISRKGILGWGVSG